MIGNAKPEEMGLLGALKALENERTELRRGNRFGYLLALTRSAIGNGYLALDQEKQRDLIRTLCGGPSSITEDEVTEVWAAIDQLPKETIHQDLPEE